MRPLLCLLLLGLSGCDWFTPPCVTVSCAICDVGSEGDACAFVMNLSRDDKPSQAICKDILPAAKGLAAEPRSAAAQAEWKTARATLATIGLVTDEKRGRIEDKLKRANGLAGKLVEDAEKNSAMGEKQTAEGAEHAFDAINK